MSKSTITFVTALSCEAKALLDHYRAKKVGDKPFALFCADNEQYQVEVLVSGIGALAMATAVGWLGAHRPSELRAWLNIGTAGHATKSTGEAFRVHASNDILSERSHFPPLVVRSSFTNDELISVNAPSSDYPAQGGMDMEAYAFFNAATRFSSNELVQAIKVVSDNPDHGLENLNATAISAFLQPHTQAITQFAQSMLDSANQTLGPGSVLKNGVIKITFPNLHFTHSQQQQLDSLAAKLLALDVLDDDLQHKILHSSSFKKLSGLLNKRLERHVPTL